MSAEGYFAFGSVFVWYKSFFLFFLIAGFNLFPIGQVAQARQRGNCILLPDLEWREARSQAFVFLYPAQWEALGMALSNLYGSTLDGEVTRFTALFETTLSLPITIRVYPNADFYTCLNALAPELPNGATHSHVGGREIALVGDAILADFEAWQRNALELFRFELASLYLQAIVGDQPLPGLETGLGYYLQDPEQTIAALNINPAEWQHPSRDWRELWEEDEVRLDFGAGLQSTSIVAYLVDVYSWPEFLKFLKQLPTVDHYRVALEDALGRDFIELEDDWRSYFPLYFRERWRTNAIYNYDLRSQEELLKAGAYTDAQNALAELLPFLEKTGQEEKLLQANEMLQRAQTGLSAGSLAVQAHNALVKGEYANSISLIDQAEQAYSRLGDFSRMDELNAYRNRALRILELHQELDNLESQTAKGLDSLLLQARTFALGRELRELGDAVGQERVQTLSESIAEQQRTQYLLLSLPVLLVILALLGIRIRISRRQPYPEAQL